MSHQFHILDSGGRLVRRGAHSRQPIATADPAAPLIEGAPPPIRPPQPAASALPAGHTLVAGPAPTHLLRPFAEAEWDSQQSKWKRPPHAERRHAQRQRAAAVQIITVTVGNKTFNGDETSQARMLRRIFAMQQSNRNTTEWVLADNRTATVTLVDLIAAFTAANDQQSAQWAGS